MGVIQDTDTIAYLFLHQLPHTLSKRTGNPLSAYNG